MDADPRLIDHPSAPKEVQEAELDSQTSTEPYALPANLRVDDVSKAINPFIDKIVKNEAQPTAGFMREANEAVQRVLDLPLLTQSRCPRSSTWLRRSCTGSSAMRLPVRMRWGVGGGRWG